MDGITLVARAEAAGLRIERSGGNLIVQGPRRLEPIAREALANKVVSSDLCRRHATVPRAWLPFSRRLDRERCLVSHITAASFVERGDPRDVVLTEEMHLKRGLDMVAIGAVIDPKAAFPGARVLAEP